MINKRQKAGYWFLIPGLAVLSLVAIAPVLSVANNSFQEWILTQTPDGPVGYVGLENYRAAISDPQLHNSIWVTAVYTAITTILSIGLGVLIALFVQRGGRWSTVLKSMLIFPFAISLVVRGYSFRFFLLDGGVLDAFLDLVTPLDDTIWLGSTWWARFWISIPVVWSWGPLTGLMLTGAINNIPPDLFEAARVDGANPRQIFWRITLPLLRPMILVASLLVVLFSVRMYDLIPTMTFAGPGRDTEIINYFIYRKGFQEWDIGYSSALAMLLTFALVGFSYIYARMILPKEGAGNE